MLNFNEKQFIEKQIIEIIKQHAQYGINTRELADKVLSSVSNTIPQANIYHIWGMFSWVLKSNSNSVYLTVRTPGYSVAV